MTKAEAVKKYREAATASPIKGGFYRSDNFGDIAFRLRHKPYAEAEITEVAANIVSVKSVRGEQVIEEFFYVK